MKKEKTKIIEAKFKVKIQTILETSISKDFNNYHMTIKARFIMIIQKNQAKKLVFININNNIKV